MGTILVKILISKDKMMKEKHDAASEEVFLIGKIESCIHNSLIHFTEHSNVLRTRHLNLYNVKK